MAEWYQKQGQAAASELKVSADKGLDESEAAKRLQQYGPNTLQKPKKINLVALFFSQLNDVLVIVLLISATVSLGISFIHTEKPEMLCSDFNHESTSVMCVATDSSGKPVYTDLCGSEYVVSDGVVQMQTQDSSPTTCATSVSVPVNKHGAKIEDEGPKEAILIFAIVIAIAVIGFFNEYKAEKTVEALRKLVGQKAKVRRGGKIEEVDAETLVPGDILVLEEGQKIPADMRLLVAKKLGGERVFINWRIGSGI